MSIQFRAPFKLCVRVQNEAKFIVMPQSKAGGRWKPELLLQRVLANRRACVLACVPACVHGVTALPIIVNQR